LTLPLAPTLAWGNDEGLNQNPGAKTMKTRKYKDAEIKPCGHQGFETMPDGSCAVEACGKTRMTIKEQIKKAINMSDKTKHTEDCIDANDDTSVFAGVCICPKSQHTPGPWHRNVSPAWKYPIYADKNGIPEGKDWIHIAAVLPGNPNGEADLNLITAAPELLEALKLAVTALKRIRNYAQIDDSGLEEMAKAIAKAEVR
jgi:hypothetical protein